MKIRRLNLVYEFAPIKSKFIRGLVKYGMIVWDGSPASIAPTGTSFNNKELISSLPLLGRAPPPGSGGAKWARC